MQNVLISYFFWCNRLIPLVLNQAKLCPCIKELRGENEINDGLFWLPKKDTYFIPYLFCFINSLKWVISSAVITKLKVAMVESV